jgi:hypothetical protein
MYSNYPAGLWILHILLPKKKKNYVSTNNDSKEKRLCFHRSMRLLPT